ncbi:MAG: type II secretion system F family protein [Egicoccus sp.]
MSVLRRLRTAPAAEAPTPGQAAALDVLRLQAAAGLPPRDLSRLMPRARRSMAVAAATGAPMLPALDAAAAAQDDLAATRRAVAVASAQTKAVAGGLLAAPFVLVPFLGGLFEADLVGFYATPGGRLVGGLGLVLLGIGALAVMRLVRRVGAPPPPPRSAPVRAVRACLVALVLGAVFVPALGVLAGIATWRRSRTTAVGQPGVDEAADLTATALSAGVGPGEALRVSARHLPTHAADLRGLALELELGLAVDHDGPLERLGAVLRAATDVGAPAAPALRRLAAELRADERARVLAAAERLPAQLTFPTALALLPATLLLVGAPIVQVGLQQALP